MRVGDEERPQRRIVANLTDDELLAASGEQVPGQILALFPDISEQSDGLAYL